MQLSEEQRREWQAAIQYAIDKPTRRRSLVMRRALLYEDTLLAVAAHLAALEEFHAGWTRAESNRGCYSCCPAHDNRCEKDRGISDQCTCGRDELDRLDAALAGEEASREG